MAAAPRRTHGMEWPLSTPQVLAGGIELAVTAATFVLFGVYARSEAVAIPVVLYAVCFAGVLFGWAYCEFLDPSLPVREEGRTCGPPALAVMALACHRPPPRS